MAKISGIFMGNSIESDKYYVCTNAKNWGWSVSSKIELEFHTTNQVTSIEERKIALNVSHLVCSQATTTQQHKTTHTHTMK